MAVTPAQSLHAAACTVLGMSGHGTYSAVAERLGLDRGYYHAVVTGSRGASLDQLSRWAVELGCTVVVDASGVRVLASPLEVAREAVRMVEGIPDWMPEDERAHAEDEVVGVAHRMRDLIRWLGVPDAE